MDPITMWSSHRLRLEAGLEILVSILNHHYCTPAGPCDVGAFRTIQECVFCNTVTILKERIDLIEGILRKEKKQCSCY
jgi:hypothetical protein